MNQLPTPAQWSWTTRFVFRWLFAYFVLYLPTVLMNAIPITELVGDPYQALWDPIVLWVGQHVIRLAEPITIRPAGSGDTTWNYVQVFCFAVIASAVAIVWTLLDRRRPHYQCLAKWLRVYIRLALSTTMITYGAVKVIKAQFPDLSAERLLQPFGNASPMGLLWTFMGASTAYNVFAGAGEMLGGLLLIPQRTTLLGALVSFGVMAHVAALNYCYDVPVKLLSTHLIVMALFLIAPDGARLMKMFVLNRPVEPSPTQPLFRWHWLNAVAGFVWVFLLVNFAAFMLVEAYDSKQKFGEAGVESPISGIWTVEEFSTDGQTRPALVTDGDRWRRVIFQSRPVMFVQYMNDRRRGYRSELNEQTGKLKLHTGPDAKSVVELTIKRLSADTIELSGSLDGKAIVAKLGKQPSQEFPLTTRGFHWINEFPYNR